MMTKIERVKAALNGDNVDRIPMSIWLHYPHKDQDPRSLADTQIEMARKYDYDFIKMMPFGLYSVQDFGAKVKIFGTTHQPPIIDEYGINTINDWNKLEVLPATYGTYGKQLQFAQHLSNQVQNELPFIQTIFSPMTTAYKLAGERIYQDMKEDPKLFHQALKVITETTINFVKANIEAGVSGFFFATKNATTNEMSEIDFDKFALPYDLEVFNSFQDKTYFNVIHIHGDNIMFEKLSKYPGNCISWHDRWVTPTLSEARKITDKCLLGGINEKGVLAKASPDEIQAHIYEAIQDAGRNKLMIGPGCVAEPLTPEINYYAARIATERFSGR
jgi:uroporphyrinogen decarboxylase